MRRLLLLLLVVVCVGCVCFFGVCCCFILFFLALFVCFSYILLIETIRGVRAIGSKIDPHGFLELKQSGLNRFAGKNGEHF